MLKPYIWFASTWGRDVAAQATPQGQIRRALHTYHNLHGHQGTKRTIGLISRLYYWPSLDSDVSAHIGACDACARSKVGRVALGAFHLAGDGDYPWDVVTVDLYSVGFNDDGYDHVLVFADQFTRGVVAVADWYATFAHLASLDPNDPGQHPAASLPKPFGHGSFPIDSVNLWPWLVSGGNGTAPPRQRLVLGKFGGEAMVAAGGWKIVVGAQSPDWWHRGARGI